MNIEKAIAVLTDILDYVKPGDPPEEHYAIKLGIEALKRVLDVRRFPDASNWKPLPGETEDSSEAAQEINPEEATN